MGGDNRRCLRGSGRANIPGNVPMRSAIRPVLKPGDGVEINILEVRPLPAGVLQHFTGKDLVSRWDGVGSTLLEQPVLPGA